MSIIVPPRGLLRPRARVIRSAGGTPLFLRMRELANTYGGSFWPLTQAWVDVPGNVARDAAAAARHMAINGATLVAGAGDLLAGMPGREVFDGVNDRIQRPGYDAGLWTLPFTVIGFSRIRVHAGDGMMINRSQNLQREFSLMTRGWAYDVYARQYDNLGAAFSRASGNVTDGLWHIPMVVVESIAGNTQIHLVVDGANFGFHAGGAAPRDTSTIPLLVGADFANAALNTYINFFNGDECMILILPGYAAPDVIDTELYTLAGGGGALVPGIVPQEMIFRDNFNGAGGTRLNTRTADTVDPTATLYTEHFGVWDVTGAAPFQARPTAVVGARATISAGAAPSRVVARIGSGGPDYIGGVIGRGVDGGNFWLVRIDTLGNTVKLYDFTGGLFTEHDSAAWAGAAGTYYTVEIRFDGNVITGWVNGTQYVTFTSGLHAGGQRIGVYSPNDANTRFDWLEAWG